MIYLSFNDSDEKNNVIEVLKDLGIKENKYFIDDSSDKSIKWIRDSKLIICDSSNEIIRTLVAFNKRVVVYRRFKVKDDSNNDILFNNKVSKYSQRSELKDILNYELNSSKKKNFSIKLALFIFIILIVFVFSFSYNFIGKEKNDGNIVNKKKESKPNNKSGNDNNVTNEMDYKYENVVFYGDSITELYDLEKHFGKLPAINSGTSGYQTKDLIKLVDERVIRYNPTKVVILIGTNDIAFSDITDQELVDNIKLIINKIYKKRPKTKIYVESLYPVNRNEDNNIVKIKMVNIRENSRIININKLIKKMCSDNNIDYINLYDSLTDDNGDLCLDYTFDGLHLNEAGYDVITEIIKKHIYNKDYNKVI